MDVDRKDYAGQKRAHSPSRSPVRNVRQRPRSRSPYRRGRNDDRGPRGSGGNYNNRGGNYNDRRGDHNRGGDYNKRGVDQQPPTGPSRERNPRPPNGNGFRRRDRNAPESEDLRNDQTGFKDWDDPRNRPVHREQREQRDHYREQKSRQPAKREKYTVQQIDWAALEALPDEERMKKVMGFEGFKTTKDTKVPGNDRNYGVYKKKKTEYRQYMNREGGFNRPLSPGR